MKISELGTARAADVLCELTPYIENLSGDTTLVDELQQKISMKGKTITEISTYVGQKLTVLAPLLLKDHRADVFGILAVLQETDVETIGKQSLLTTMAQVRELIQDDDLIDFFQSWVHGDETE